MYVYLHLIVALQSPMDLRLLLAFFQSLMFLEASLRFFLLPVTVPVQTQVHHLLLRLPLVLTSSGSLFKNFLKFSGTMHPIVGAEPVQSWYVCKCDDAMYRHSLQSVPTVTVAVSSSIDPPKGFPLGCPQPFINISPEGPCFCSIQDDDDDGSS
jgi:hypothetical protein